MNRTFTRFFAFILLMGSSWARADTSLTVDIGWGGHVRPHRWMPVMVTASDSTTRNVQLEVFWPHGGNYAMRVRQVFAIGPTPSTFELLLPSHSYYGYQEAVFTLSDPESGKTLARFPKDPGNWQMVTPMVGNDVALVGVSGQSSALQSLHAELNSQQLSIDYLPPALLPMAALGYDSLDLLVLNQANLGVTGEHVIDAAQQQAIVDWVRAGGNLIAWPSAVMPFPSSGPLADVLSCRLGDRGTLNLTAEDLHALGLGSRFAKLTMYAATPQAEAQPIHLLNGSVTAYTRRVGLGRIVVAPICIGDLMFDDTEKGRAMWEPLVAGMHVLPHKGDVQQSRSARGSSMVRNDQKEADAAMTVADQLGDIPGAGEFGFAYVLVVLVGMMIVVGPVDWWVLRKLGRQSWTWVTTSGWIALITLVAVSAGYLFKSGDLHYRTLRLVDQVDDASIASIDMVGIYSPRTRQYALETDGQSWWRPAGIEDRGRGAMPIEIGFHQTTEGNTPLPMGINVWSLRFLRGDQAGVGLPMIAASLARGSQPDQIVGVIKNLTEQPLKNVRVRVGDMEGTFALSAEKPATAPASALATAATTGANMEQIAAFATVRVQAMLLPIKLPSESDSGRVGSDRHSQPGGAWEYVGLLDIRRAQRIDEILRADGQSACVFAESVNPPAAVHLAGQTPIQQHLQYIRALIELHNKDDN